ncbi:type 1 glutamine amidotransferase domain-containing protein [Polluticoccus soli]|uniref:type 1 glutamine amidotransferase domain-containing protein n=1 Tax=Polluticoccus soli TaxID=3034150 RepID=UPI0023E32566|nr:type 1 glutamine amidotransferase domain-containing protein [Flavipsychrobacter sp. JY13-12]
MKKLKGIRVAILTEEGFEESELLKPKEALEDEGVKIDIISPESGKIRSWDKKDWGSKIAVDKTVDEASEGDYDALILPGGVINPDKLRRNEKAVSFAKIFLQSGKPVAAICHGPQLLVETGLLPGMTLTSTAAIKTDLKNAGANWIDQEVVHHANLITSRKPADLKAFNEELIKTLENIHSQRVNNTAMAGAIPE